MRYSLAILLLLPLIANAQEDIVQDDAAPYPTMAVPAPLAAPVDDAYSPNSMTNTPTPVVTQEPAPEIEPPVAEVEPLPEPEPLVPEMIEGKKATIQILDKIDARVREVEVELDKEKEYNELKIEIKRCIRSPQESKEENIAFMRIWDVGQGDYTNIVFSGWMFSSNPALHSFEHPLYDVVLLKCAD